MCDKVRVIPHMWVVVDETSGHALSARKIPFRGLLVNIDRYQSPEVHGLSCVACEA